MKIENSRSSNVVRFWAGSLLLLSAALFVVSKILENTHPAWPWLRALSEAALIGALADWFAVTALFRHPLGLPIPHTAIIPKNQERIAAALSRFVQDNFLNPESLASRLKTSQVTHKLSVWLSDPAQAKTLALQLKDLFRGLLESADDKVVSGFIAQAIPALSQQLKLAPLCAEVIASIKESDKNGRLFDEIVCVSERLLQKHNQVLETLVSKELPWYIPGFIKQRLYAQVTEAMRRTLAAMQTDKDHILRQQLIHLTDKVLNDLRENPNWEKRIQAIITSACERETIINYLSNLKESLVSRLSTDPDELIMKSLITILSFSARSICKDPQITQKIDQLLCSITLRVVHDYGHQAGNFIEQTMRSWDSRLLSNKIEAEVGRDLQFIRINGTVVGALVGVLIHAIVQIIEKT